MAVNVHTKLAFAAMHPDEKRAPEVLFPLNAVAYCGRLGITKQRLLTNYGSELRSREFKAICIEHGIKHSFTRPTAADHRRG